MCIYIYIYIYIYTKYKKNIIIQEYLLFNIQQYNVNIIKSSWYICEGFLVNNRVRMNDPPT